MTPIAVLLALTGASAATLNVPGNFPDLPSAVAGAASGDVIRLSTSQDLGTSTLAVGGKNLTVVGIPPANDPQRFPTIRVDLNTDNGMFSVGSSGTLTLRDLSLRSGNITAGQFGAVADPAELYTSNFGLSCLGIDFGDDGTPDYNGIGHGGTGVVVTGGAVTFQNVTTQCLGSAILGIGLITIEDSLFQGAQSGHLNLRGGELSVTGSAFEESFGWGGVVAIGMDEIAIVDSSFNRNNAFYVSPDELSSQPDSHFNPRGGGGAAMLDGDSIFLSDNRFQDNVAGVLGVDGFEGGAVFARAADVTMKRNAFCNNTAQRGGAVSVRTPSLDFTNNVIVANYAVFFGGGLYMDGTEAYDDAYVVNNTFLANQGGRTPEWLEPQVNFAVGAGGHAMFDDVNPVFRNNIAAYSGYGGGVAGVDTFSAFGYEVGDVLDFEYNILFQNSDGENGDSVHFTGDFASSAVPQSNAEVDPIVTYWGVEDFNCYVDRFYTSWRSPAVDNGDPAIIDATTRSTGIVNRSDIGAYGGPDADVQDRDGDGYENIYDCNDNPSTNGTTSNPGVAEICDGVDNDCDGLVDEGFDTRWYRDSDGDGFGDINQLIATISCGQPSGFVQTNDDCDDSDSATNPGATEVCDGLDNDCSSVPDDNLQYYTYYRDADSDGYGNENVQRSTCAQSPAANEVGQAGDCDDNRAEVSPGAGEGVACDGLDNNCNGIVDDLPSLPSWYFDGDGDGIGGGLPTDPSCDAPGDAYVSVGEDCDDNDSAIGAPEQYYPDFDGDGFGDATLAEFFCANEVPSNPAYVQKAGDCDDADPYVGECNASCGGCSSTSPSGVAGVMMSMLVLLGMRRRR